jgi:hypothetical protein
MNTASTPESKKPDIEPSTSPRGRFPIFRRRTPVNTFSSMRNAPFTDQILPDEPLAEPPKPIESLDDLPLRDVAIMVGSFKKSFTLDGIVQRFAENHLMTPDAQGILRQRVYQLGAMRAIDGKPTDIHGKPTSIWNRTESGDKVLDEIIGSPDDVSES